MRTRKYALLIMSLLLLGMTACRSRAAAKESATFKESGVTHSDAGRKSEVSGMESFTMPNGKKVYYHVPQAVRNKPAVKVPMVLFMCGTTCDPVDNCVDSGWIGLAEKENIIVVSPDYNNYATYSETDFLISVVKHMLEHYPVDAERVYSTGFSNGGAASVALTRDYPQYFAAISAMGWMSGLDNRNGVYQAYDMPFQVVQGSGEFTERLPSGAIVVMDDEKRGIRDLMLYNEMLSENRSPDYDKTPYWGYAPDATTFTIVAGRKVERKRNRRKDKMHYYGCVAYCGGQLLICVGGRGWYQAAGQNAVPMTPGVAVTIPANVKHWHGAAKDSWFSHLAISIPGEDTSNEWCEPVSDAEYGSLE